MAIAAIAGLVIPAIGQMAMPLVEKLWKNSPEWIDVIQQAVAGVPAAVSAIASLIKGYEAGVDFTPDELRTKLAEARGVHEAIQASGTESDS